MGALSAVIQLNLSHLASTDTASDDCIIDLSGVIGYVSA